LAASAQEDEITASKVRLRGEGRSSSFASASTDGAVFTLDKDADGFLVEAATKERESCEVEKEARREKEDERLSIDEEAFEDEEGGAGLTVDIDASVATIMLVLLAGAPA
jgi:hypothetical protein